MKKNILVLIALCIFLSACTNSENNMLQDSSDINLNVSSESIDNLDESTLESNLENSNTETVESSFEGKTRADFDTANKLYEYYQGDNCIVSKNNEFENDIFITESYDPENMTLAGLFQYEPNSGSSDIANQILITFSNIVDSAERNNAYRHIYLDWAFWGGKSIAYWTLSRGDDGKFYQDSNIVWSDTYIEDAFNEIMNS